MDVKINIVNENIVQVFTMVAQFMLCRNYAKQQVGLFARIISKVSALIILQYINFINNKPIGRVKYALV